MANFSKAKITSFIMTQNRAAAKEFYQKKLGLEFSLDDEYGSVFVINGGTLRITEIPQNTPSEHPILGFETDDIKTMVQGLVQNGVKMEIYDGYGQDELGIWHSPDGKTKLAWFKDPDGNLLSFSQG